MARRCVTCARAGVKSAERNSMSSVPLSTNYSSPGFIFEIILSAFSPNYPITGRKAMRVVA